MEKKRYRRRKMKKIVSILAVICLLFPLFQAPGEVSAASASEVKKWEKSLKDSIARKSWNNAAIYSKHLAVHYDEKGQYDLAAKYYDDNAMYWAKAGHADWGIQNSIRADHIRTEVELYVEQPLPLNQKLGKFEPKSGTYLGLFLAGKRENANPDRVEGIYGKNHAIYLTYTTWGKKYADTNTYFPMTFAKNAKANGSGIQIGFEPMNGLDEVKDGEYIRQFAREAKESGVPVFLRFAGEMNGEWVPWSGDPKKYIEKFRLVYNIMKEEAPNVAMVWSPNFLPRHNIEPYYPGDQYVDWVGISLYTIPFSHGKEVPGGNPIDYLKPIYEKYSHKPMMVSEGAVSHYSYELRKDFSEWASGQIGNMYGFMPRMFPQVKSITYFNLDKQTTNYDNQNNNYDLGASPITDKKYQTIINSPYFIDHLVWNEPINTVESKYVPVKDLKEVAGVHNAFAYVKLPLGKQPYYVAVYQGKTKLGESYAQPWDMKIDFSKVNPKLPLKVIAFDKNFKYLAQKEIKGNFKVVEKLGKFTDVKERFWAFADIEKAEEEGLVNGYPDGSFRPNQEVTTAEFVAMLGRSYKVTDDLEKAPYPTGVTEFMKAKNYPYSEKMNTAITRKEVAEIISGSRGMNLAGDDAIKYLLVNGLAQGKIANEVSVGSYLGEDTLTRAEAVTFVANLRRAGSPEILERPSVETDATVIREEYQAKFAQ